ncbi:unnamed protein product [Choristocarpus tenellus]
MPIDLETDEGAFQVCSQLSLDLAYRRTSTEDLCIGIAGTYPGMRVRQIWPASNGGWTAFTVQKAGHLIVVFRGTSGLEELVQYPEKVVRGAREHRFHKEGWGVYSVWWETLAKVWTKDGVPQDGDSKTYLKMEVLDAFAFGDRVWFTGHSKGGAVAAVAAALILFGDDGEERMTDAEEIDLSVITFNAPMSFSPLLAEEYDRRCAKQGVRHLRSEERADQLHEFPWLGGFQHVGEQRSKGMNLMDKPSVRFAAVAGGALLTSVVASEIIGAHNAGKPKRVKKVSSRR